MISATEPEMTLRYQAPPGVYDELCNPNGQLRPRWQQFAKLFSRLSPDEMTRRESFADKMLVENGVTFNAFSGNETGQRPWHLDLIPLILTAAEWQAVSEGLTQRARLLNLLVQDLYGHQRLITHRVLPAELLFANHRYQRPFRHLHHVDPFALTLYSAELARLQDGTWAVMADRTEAPPGLGYTLENRVVISRAMPQMKQQLPVQRLAPFYVHLQNILKLKVARRTDNPRIVVLTPGPLSPYYFEDAYLARYLGYTLVEGGDLAVRDDKVWLKTLAGVMPIDVIVSRGREAGIDPLELGGMDAHGVPGILQAIRKGNVAVCNSPGCGLIESPVFMAYLSTLCKELLGEELLIPSITTYWCGDKVQREIVEQKFDDLVIKSAFQPSGGMEYVTSQMEQPAREALREQLRLRPWEYIAQPKVARSSLPIWSQGQVQCGHAAVRAYVVADEDRYHTMHGGLVRVAETISPMELSINAGFCSKDLWVLADGPVDDVTLLAAEDKAVPLKRTGALFPSRVADNLYWLGQAIERADFLTRVYRMALERLTIEATIDNTEMIPLTRMMAHQGIIEADYAVDGLDTNLPPLETALPLQIFDRKDPNGLGASLNEMVRLASLTRDWLSPETWRQIDHTGKTFLQANSKRFSDEHIESLNMLNQLMINLASVSGLVHEGMIRGPSWGFLDLGRRIQRGVDIVRVLQSVMETQYLRNKATLKILLELLDCKMTYRNRYLNNLQHHAVLDLALTDETNPHSLGFQLAAIVSHVDRLPNDVTDPLLADEKRIVLQAIDHVRQLTFERLVSAPDSKMNDLLITSENLLRSFSDVIIRKYLVHSGIPRHITSFGAEET
jgi:uncharacterized circularly permuted ATP-grasp superfamily protein/uncharacterized alpha-E superfamily protein